jgi:homoserine O-acetyltransferase/O-succinyltransferase
MGAPEPTLEGKFTFARRKPFRLSGGGKLHPVTLQYAVYGPPDAARSGAFLVCHALSGSARAGDWWPGMFGPDGLFDLDRDCVICSNVIGSCYGSTGPASTNPRTGERYRASFPLVSIRDIVRAQAELLDHLGVAAVRAVIGGSIGGMQALQWAVDFPDRVAHCAAVGATPLSAMGLALNHLQRQAIRNDPAWLGGAFSPDAPPASGLALARSIAMCSYKSPDLLDDRFGRLPDRSGENPYLGLEARFDVAGYLDFQGEAFVRRFDANSYLVLSKAMDTFDLAMGYGSEEEALRRLRARTLLVGISSDWLFPSRDVDGLARRARDAGAPVEYAHFESSHGHDAFLAEAGRLSDLLRRRGFPSGNATRAVA